MANYGYVNALEINAGSTSDLELHQITVNGKCPTLIGKPATQDNKGYFNKLLKLSAKNARAVQAGNVTVEVFEENRAQDLELYPEFVITGWKDVVDGDTGRDVTFSQDECAAFLNALPNHIFDNVRNHFGNTDNFVDFVDIKVKEKAGNSPAA